MPLTEVHRATRPRCRAENKEAASEIEKHHLNRSLTSRTSEDSLIFPSKTLWDTKVLAPIWEESQQELH